MAYYINTEAESLGGKSPDDKCLEREYAFSDGDIDYGRKLGRMLPGDICLVWANKIGIVAVGKVLAPWDGISYDPGIVYVEPMPMPNIG